MDEAKAGKQKPVKKNKVELKTIELSITVFVVGGGDVDRELLPKVQKILEERTLAGKCSLEKGGTCFHLHLQMVIHIDTTCVLAVSKLLKQYLNWDVNKPKSGVIMCKKIVNKGLHTFYGLLGYCMKDRDKEHFETIDHNITSDNLNQRLEQYALHVDRRTKSIGYQLIFKTCEGGWRCGDNTTVNIQLLSISKVICTR